MKNKLGGKNKLFQFRKQARWSFDTKIQVRKMMKLLSISTQVSDIYIFSTSILSTRTSSFINSRYYYKFDPFQKLSPFPNIINIFNNMFNTFLISNPVHDKKTKKQKNAKVSTIKSQQFPNHLQFPIKKKEEREKRRRKKADHQSFLSPSSK